MPFKNKRSEDLQTYHQVKNLPEFAGILNEGAICIDVDEFEDSEILMTIVEDLQLKCRVYETTRGKHFFFKNSTCDTNKIKTKLAITLKADIKLGDKNSYSVLKYNDKERKIIYDIFDDEDYDVVPKWLLPVKTNMDFASMEAGEGRNQSLFNYILILQSHGFVVEEIRETIRIINRYVMKDKLDDGELETILRDDAFNQPVFYKGNSFQFDMFATYLKNNHHIIKINDQLHIYRDGIYVSGLNEIEAEMIKLLPTLNRAKRTEVMAYLDLLVRENVKTSDANYIAFRNGVYNLENDSLEGFSPDKIITNKIDYDFLHDAESKLVDNTLDKLACFDPEVRSLLEEVIGYTFYRRNELRKSFILIGDKANGKSTYLDMIKTLLGDRNTSSLDLKELGDRFKTAELFGKLANIGDDIGDEFIPNPAAFKKLCSGESMNVERKGQNPFDFTNYSKLLFSANNIPRIKDKSGAVINRLVIIPFNARFSVDDPDYDPYIKYKLRKPDAMERLIQIGIVGLKRVLENNKFTDSSRVQKELEEYEQSNNPILLFFSEVEISEIENEPTKKLYQKYTEFCLANNFNSMSNIEFSKQVRKHFNMDIVDKKINGKKYRIFVKGDKE